MSLKFDEARAMFERYFCYTFLDPTWLEEALYMGGPTKIGGRAVPNGNKRLAQLGDSVLQLATVNECFDGGLSKGDANKYLQTRACNAKLAMIGRSLGLAELMVLNDGTTEVSPMMFATTLEAVFGALFKDAEGDMEVVSRAAKALVLLI